MGASIAQAEVFVVVVRRYLLRLQFACMAQVAGSPMQVNLPLPQLVRGLTTALALVRCARRAARGC